MLTDQGSFKLQLAAQIINRHGKAATWKLHVAAAARYRDGDHNAAATLVEATEIVEGLWLDERPLSET